MLRRTRLRICSQHAPVIDAHDDRHQEHGEVVTEVEVVWAVESWVGTEYLLKYHIQQGDARSEHGEHAGEEGRPDVEAPAQRLSVSRPRRVAPVCQPDRRA